VYQGEGIETDKKSLAIGLIFREFSRNLTESEIDTVMTKILKALNHNFNAQLRK
jgi:phenylalanyl-tRNA synthetase beta chain